MAATDDGYRSHTADSPYHRTLPIGERLDATPLVTDPLSSFEAVTLRPLEPMLVPERPREGELDHAACAHCRPSEHVIWRDDDWRLAAGFEPMGLPFVGGLSSRAHHRLDDAPPALLATLGPLLQRLSTAVKAIPGVARCHFSRWGDGSEHFHLWALARPAGMMQGRGSMLAFWDGVMPKLSDDLRTEHLRVVAAALAEGGGTAFPER